MTKASQVAIEDVTRISNHRWFPCQKKKKKVHNTKKKKKKKFQREVRIFLLNYSAPSSVKSPCNRETFIWLYLCGIFTPQLEKSVI